MSTEAPLVVPAHPHDRGQAQYQQVTVNVPGASGQPATIHNHYYQGEAPVRGHGAPARPIRWGRIFNAVAWLALLGLLLGMTFGYIPGISINLGNPPTTVTSPTPPVVAATPAPPPAPKKASKKKSAGPSLEERVKALEGEVETLKPLVPVIPPVVEPVAVAPDNGGGTIP